jgi:hypothetical protein
VIAIVNVSKEPKSSGPHEYELRINRDVVCTFTHNREESLSKCLRRAADAYECLYIRSAEEVIKHASK